MGRTEENVGWFVPFGICAGGHIHAGQSFGDFERNDAPLDCDGLCTANVLGFVINCDVTGFHLDGGMDGTALSMNSTLGKDSDNGSFLGLDSGSNSTDGNMCELVGIDSFNVDMGVSRWVDDSHVLAGHTTVCAAVNK